MYSPVNVYNPSSRTHTSILNPGQSLNVTFHDISIMDECKAFVESDYLELSEEVYSTLGKTFVFKQLYDLSAWSKVSSAHLGQVSFSGMGKVNPAIGVYLESTNENKSDIITVVNPFGCTTKIYPHQIVEVVAFSPLWGHDLSWDLKIDAPLDLLAEVTIDPATYKPHNSSRLLNDAFYTYPRAVQVYGTSYLEYHWWFRYKTAAARMAKTIGVNSLGVVNITGSVHRMPKVNCEFRVILNDRCKEGWENKRSAIVSFEDSSMNKGEIDYSVQPFILPSLRNEMTAVQNHKSRKKERKERKKERWSYLAHVNQNQNKTKVKQVKPFQARDVFIALKSFNKLQDGCNVFSDDPVISLPAPTSAPTSTSVLPVVGLHGTTSFQPPKAAYYYDETLAQWD